MSKKTDEMLALLYEAAASPIGVLVSTLGEDPQAVRSYLYSVRKQANDPTLAGLQIRLSPFPDGDLVIVRVSDSPAADSLQELL